MQIYLVILLNLLKICWRFFGSLTMTRVCVWMIMIVRWMITRKRVSLSFWQKWGMLIKDVIEKGWKEEQWRWKRGRLKKGSEIKAKYKLFFFKQNIIWLTLFMNYPKPQFKKAPKNSLLSYEILACMLPSINMTFYLFY